MYRTVQVSGGVRSIVLLPIVARCLETLEVCIFYVSCNDCVGMFKFVVSRALLKIVFFSSLGVVKYVLYLCRGCDGCCVFCLKCEAGAAGARVWEVCVLLCASCGCSQCCILHDL